MIKSLIWEIIYTLELSCINFIPQIAFISGCLLINTTLIYFHPPTLYNLYHIYPKFVTPNFVGSFLWRKRKLAPGDEKYQGTSFSSAWKITSHHFFTEISLWRNVSIHSSFSFSGLNMWSFQLWFIPVVGF